MTRALLKQALEALECAYSEKYDGAKFHGAKAAIRAHLAQPQGEPVAWMWQHEETGQTGFIDIPQLEAGWAQANPRLKVMFPVFTHPAHTEEDVQSILRNRRVEFSEYEAHVRRILGVSKP